MKKLENVKSQNSVIGNAKAILCLLFVFASVFMVKGQENTDNHINLDIKQKSQQELQTIQGFLASPSVMKKSAGAILQKSKLTNDLEERPKKFKGIPKDEAVMKILLMKNQIFEGNDMPTSRKRLNVDSLLEDLKEVLTEEEYLKLINNHNLLKQLGLFVDETLDNQ
ncbi:hypothetical protein [Sphingobacterium tabacisoli]|uniref:Uncharacterized protein n=1 Tax=Sphingobacterium tabacisoli TaxID=2044855 RepID=A0ABW5KY55_9SPHI|nr:hypothetical protein [Sphingobacterium tabacisoli]